MLFAGKAHVLKHTVCQALQRAKKFHDTRSGRLGFSCPVDFFFKKVWDQSVACIILRIYRWTKHCLLWYGCVLCKSVFKFYKAKLNLLMLFRHTCMLSRWWNQLTASLSLSVRQQVTQANWRWPPVTSLSPSVARTQVSRQTRSWSNLYYCWLIM